MKTQKTGSTAPGAELEVDPARMADLVKSDLKVAFSVLHLVETKQAVTSAVVVALDLHTETSRHYMDQLEEIQKDAQLAAALIALIVETPAIFSAVVDGMIGLQNNAVAREQLKKQAAAELRN